MNPAIETSRLSAQLLVLLGIADRECPHSFGCNECRAAIIASAIREGFLP